MLGRSMHANSVSAMRMHLQIKQRGGMCAAHKAAVHGACIVQAPFRPLRFSEQK